MFGLSGLAIKVAIGMGIAMVLMAAGFGWYFTYSQDKLAEANQLIAIQTVKAASAEANLEFAQESVREQQKNLKKLTDASVIIRQEQEKTIDIFADHDLKALAERKPGLIQRRVNKGTAAVFAELERLSDPRTYRTLPGQEFVKDED